MMVLHRDTGVLEHRHIADIVDYIEPDDLLVVNDTKVFPARLIGEWPDTHGQVEVLLVAPAPVEGVPNFAFQVSSFEFQGSSDSTPKPESQAPSLEPRTSNLEPLTFTL